MNKKRLALSGTLLLVPIAALAQDANTGNVEKSLPPVTVLSDKEAEPAKQKVPEERQRIEKGEANNDQCAKSIAKRTGFIAWRCKWTETG